MGAWIPYAAIGTVVGLATLFITLIIHIIKYGEEKGAMSVRVLRLEQEMKEQKDMKDTVIKLDATVNVLTATVSELRGFLHTVMQGK